MCEHTRIWGQVWCRGSFGNAEVFDMTIFLKMLVFKHWEKGYKSLKDINCWVPNISPKLFVLLFPGSPSNLNTSKTLVVGIGICYLFTSKQRSFQLFWYQNCTLILLDFEKENVKQLFSEIFLKKLYLTQQSYIWGLCSWFMVLAVFLIFLFQAEAIQQTTSNITTFGKNSISFDWVGSF